MIDLDAMNRDPWPTWPVNKEDLLRLASALQEMEAIGKAQHKVIMVMRATLDEIVKTDIAAIGAASRMRTIAKITVDKL